MTTTTTTATTTTTTKEKTPIEILIMDGDPLHDWVSIFKIQPRIHVVQASWIETTITCYSNSQRGGGIVIVAPIRESNGKVTRPQTTTIQPDLVIIRNQPRGPTPNSDRRSVLFGLIATGIPSMNSLVSEYMQLERPVMCGGLREIEHRIGHELFPFIEQNYYSSAAQGMVIAPEMPCIMKVSHAHRGMGKMLCKSNAEFRDLSTVLSLYPESESYSTGEPFIEADYGIRVQKIGNDHYRVMKKVYTGSGWKSQFGGADLQEIALNDEYKRWVDEASKLFGGLDWCAIDALHGRNGKNYIIELNGSAIGFLAERWVEDTIHIRDLVFNRLQKLNLL